MVADAKRTSLTIIPQRRAVPSIESQVQELGEEAAAFEAEVSMSVLTAVEAKINQLSRMLEEAGEAGPVRWMMCAIARPLERICLRTSASTTLHFGASARGALLCNKEPRQRQEYDVHV